jgi:hypothetical protein
MRNQLIEIQYEAMKEIDVEAKIKFCKFKSCMLMKIWKMTFLTINFPNFSPYES